MKFRKKPVVIEAEQFDGSHFSADHIFLWSGKTIRKFYGPKGDLSGLVVKTLEGTTRAEGGDWIIRGVEGEYYACKPRIFEKSYEKVEE